MINYFNFKKFKGQYLLTNDLGRYVFLECDEFRELLKDSNVSNDVVRNRLLKNGFIYSTGNRAFSDKFRQHYMNAKNYLFSPTQLHIFVLTNKCNLNCLYCQANTIDSKSFDFMTIDIAKKAVDFAMQSPAENLTFEFQGGEPLLNFEVLKFIVEYSEQTRGNKNIQYSVATNLTLLSDEMIDFFVNHSVSVSTSIDGDAVTHNNNRPYKNNEPSLEKVKCSVEKLREKGVYVGALMTTTRISLSNSKKIIDSYVELGFDSISIRPLTPLGCAKDRWNEIGYTPDEFIEFYKDCFNYILSINKNGSYIKESIAAIYLKKILSGVAVNYMELRSPCGATLGQIAYYANGKIYTCDEGRMLANMGNEAFLLGNVFDNDYKDIIGNSVCKTACHSSIAESLASCSECAYLPYCGVCPVVNYALYGDVYEKTPKNYRCLINSGVLNIIFEKLQEDDYQIRQIFRSWIN